MIWRRLNKIIETNDPEKIKEYKLLGFTETVEEPEPTGRGREPEPEKPTTPEKEVKRGRPSKNIGEV